MEGDFRYGGGSSRRRKWSSSGNSLPSIPAPTGGSFRCDYARRGGGAGEWRSPRYGLPGTPLATATGWAAWSCRPHGKCIATPRPARHARGESPDSASARYSPWKRPCGRSGPWSFAGAAHARGAALQLSRRPVYPLGYARPVGEHVKYLVSARPGDGCLAGRRRRGIWARAITLSAGRRRRGAVISVFSLTILAISFCLGSASAFGVARSRSDGAQNRGRLGTDLRAPHLFFLETSWIPNATRHVLSGGELGGDGAHDGRGKNARTSGRTGRSRKCWAIRSRRAFVSCWRK